MVTMTKTRKYRIHALVEIRCKVMAKEVLLIEVAKSPKAAPTMVLRLISLRFSSLIVFECRPKPRETVYVLMETAMARHTCT